MPPMCVPHMSCEISLIRDETGIFSDGVVQSLDNVEAMFSAALVRRKRTEHCEDAVPSCWASLEAKRETSLDRENSFD